MKITEVQTTDLIPYARNARKHDEAQVAQIAASIREFGFNNPVLIGEDKTIIAGHGRVLAAQKLGLEKVPCITLGHLTDTQRRAYVIADNRLAETGGGWDIPMLALEIEDLRLDGLDIDLTGFSSEALDALFDGAAGVGGGDGQSMLQKIQNSDGGQVGSLSDRYIVPPFSVLRGDMQEWIEKKKALLHEMHEQGQTREGLVSKNFGGSILDPYLCQILINWYSSEGDLIGDPFAGDLSFGYMAGKLGRKFFGTELRQEQVDINVARTKIFSDITYVCSDGMLFAQKCENQLDMVFSCPPYFNLEVYSELENDASNQGDYSDFLKICNSALLAATSKLKSGGYCVVVMSPVLGKNGGYYNIPGDIVNALSQNGLLFYSDMVLLDPIGTAPIRADMAFKNKRRVTRVHQNVLVFKKG